MPVRQSRVQSRVQSMFTQVTERLWEIETRDLPMTASSHLALFRLVGLSKRKIIEPSLTAFTGFPFALVLDVAANQASRVKNRQTKKKTHKTHQVHSVLSGPSN